MRDEAILDLPVSRLAAPDAVLFMWATWPKLPVAIDVMAAWGFRYKTIGFVWIKTAKAPSINGVPRLHWGMGRWTRANSEPCLMGTRGRPLPRNHSTHSVVHAPPGRHSEKPIEVRGRIEALGSAPRLEMFLRGPTPHRWWGWGNQAQGDRVIALSA